MRPWRSNSFSKGLTATLSGTLAAVASVFALLSAGHSIRHVHHILETERAHFGAMTPTERNRAAVAQTTLDGQIFDFYRSLVSRGDRVYFQVMPSGFSSDYDLPTIVSALGRFYLLPAVQTSDLRDATVVVSYFADPSLLHVKFITQVRAGLQPLWVSRIKAP